MPDPTGTVTATIPRHAYQGLAETVCRLCPGADMEIVEKTPDTYAVEIRTDRAGFEALLERDRLVKTCGRN